MFVFNFYWTDKIGLEVKSVRSVHSFCFINHYCCVDSLFLLNIFCWPISICFRSLYSWNFNRNATPFRWTNNKINFHLHSKETEFEQHNSFFEIHWAEWEIYSISTGKELEIACKPKKQETKFRPNLIPLLNYEYIRILSFGETKEKIGVDIKWVSISSEQKNYESKKKNCV